MRSRPVLIFLGLVALILLISSLRMVWRAYQASNAREKAQVEYERLLAQKTRIDETLGDLENSDVLEKEAKRRFNITSPGERVLIIVDREEEEGLMAKPPHLKLWNFVKNFFE